MLFVAEDDHKADKVVQRMEAALVEAKDKSKTARTEYTKALKVRLKSKTPFKRLLNAFVSFCQLAFVLLCQHVQCTHCPSHLSFLLC